MLSVLPFWSHQCLRNIINSIVTTNTVGPQFDEMKKYSKEVTGLLSAAIQNNAVPTVVSFLIHLVNRIENLHHSRNRPTPPVDEIPNSYDPRKGVTYYFTESGSQLRRMPGYEEVGGSKNYDDPPEVDPGCTKKLPWCFIWWLWISILMVLPNTWTFLWVPPDSWRRRKKGPFFINFQIQARCTTGIIL